MSGWRRSRERKVSEDEMEERTVGVLGCVDLVRC